MLTPSQRRVLSFLAEFPGYRTLTELDRIRLLEADDVVVVPSLVERGLLHHHRALQAVRITPAGAVLAREAAA